jgi:transposase
VDRNVDPRDARIAQLEQLLQAALDAIVALNARVAELEGQLGQNSKNSSKPPSTDPPEMKRSPPKLTGRKRGGQPGHEGAKRVRLTPDEVIDHRPRRCQCCAQLLQGSDPNPRWFQVFELPEIKPKVTEHRGHALVCGGCGTVTSEPLPDEVLLHGFGPRFSGLLAYLTGRCRLSKRQAVELCEDAFNLPISVGAVCAIEQDVAAALAGPVEEARAAVRDQPVVHVDETGWREDKQRAWLWVAVSAVATVFLIARSRSGRVARQLLGENFHGLLVTDRWSGYTWVQARQRQLCWAHLKRDLQGMIDRGGVGGGLAADMLAQVTKMFEWWARVGDGSLDRTEFQCLMKPIRDEVERLLVDASLRAEQKTAGMCDAIFELRPALWTFVDNEGVEPTNNAAERAIRPAVLWRKGSFGNDSAAGSRFSERVLTAVATVRLRGGSVLDYLTDACASYRATRTAPSLLTVASAK